MDNLAPELLHMICSYLTEYEIPPFRLVNRSCASVGLEYLISEIKIHLHRNSFKAHSFERLLAISSHPVMSKTVRELSYDSEMLESPMKDFESWKAGAVKMLKRRNQQPWGGRPRLTFDPIQHNQDYKRLYAWYQSIMDQQSWLVDNMMDFPVIKHALSNFDNLEKVTMSTYNKMYITDIYCRIGPWDYALESPTTQIAPVGVRQLNSLLLGVAASPTKLKKLRAGYVDWKWFCSEPYMVQEVNIRAACENLTSLHMIVSCLGRYWGEQAPACLEHVSVAGTIKSFLSRLPSLESLKFRFDDVNRAEGPRYPARLEHLVEENFVWPKLRKLELGVFQASEDDLLGLVQRHAKTLRIFGLHESVELDPGGSWLTLLPRIKETLKLERTNIYGILETRAGPNNRPERWALSNSCYNSEPNALWAGKLEDYLVRGGVMPLRVEK